MLSSLFCTLRPGGNPAAGPILKKRVLCPSTRNPIASRPGVPRGAGLQMLCCGKQVAGSCSWQGSLGCSGSRRPEEISAGCSETPGAAHTGGAAPLGAREAFCLLGCGREVHGHSDERSVRPPSLPARLLLGTKGEKEGKPLSPALESLNSFPKGSFNCSETAGRVSAFKHMQLPKVLPDTC